MKVTCLTVGAFAENTYLVVDGDAAVVIDPGDEAERIVAAVDQANVPLQAIWVTHGHLDHVGAIAALKRRYDVPVLLHAEDLPLYRTAAQQAAHFGLPFEQPPDPDGNLTEGGSVVVGSQRFEVWHLPGHAPGHVVFVGEEVVFGGDVLFEGSIGRTDLPLCDERAMRRSLARLTSLPDAMTVYPGHGPATTIGREVVANPFLTGIARPSRQAVHRDA